jgi:hypothetical protein
MNLKYYGHLHAILVSLLFVIYLVNLVGYWQRNDPTSNIISLLCATIVYIRYWYAVYKKRFKIIFMSTTKDNIIKVNEI